MRNEAWLKKSVWKIATFLSLMVLLSETPARASGPPPVILVQPLSVSVLNLGIATFTVVASSGTTMTYQWFKNGNVILGATSATYSLVNVTTADQGTYTVKITNAGGTVTSSPATLAVMAPPSISSQPSSQTVLAGQNVSFSVAASGSSPFTYQWYVNGSAISGGNGSTLTLHSVQTRDAGNYTVIIGNAYGSIGSTAASLTVNVPLSIDSQPKNQAVMITQPANLSVTASGTGPLAYAWQFNGSPLSNGTSSSLQFSHASLSNAGAYSVVVANSSGSQTSKVATLTVNLPDVRLTTTTAQPASGAFNFKVSVTSGLTYIVQASTDLQNWTPIATNVASTDNPAFSDPDAPNYPQRFYRAVAVVQ
ncbi:MAG TPA: immunoglobulin domain-containing protein [Candidatus Dormibacteraeota bacterium]|nr:immunoglobulin domain-containing protein [Candidatus Dormibacteraeota bacterium]